jgi:hypothetical protein
VAGGFAAGMWSLVATEPHPKVFAQAAAAFSSLVMAAALYLYFATLNGWWPTGRRRRSRAWPETSSGRPLGVGLGALIPPLLPPPEPESPLELTLEDEDWELWQGLAWIAAVKVRLTNVTADQVIRLERFYLESDPGDGDRPRLTQAQVDGLLDETLRRGDRIAHLKRIDLHPGDSTSGWWVQSAFLPYPAGAGRPRCVFKVTDGVGDTYELEIPARAPQVRRMGSEW